MALFVVRIGLLHPLQGCSNVAVDTVSSPCRVLQPEFFDGSVTKFLSSPAPVFDFLSVRITGRVLSAVINVIYSWHSEAQHLPVNPVESTNSL
jgi:hypothetical protein